MYGVENRQKKKESEADIEKEDNQKEKMMKVGDSETTKQC